MDFKAFKTPSPDICMGSGAVSTTNCLCQSFSLSRASADSSEQQSSLPRSILFQSFYLFKLIYMRICDVFMKGSLPISIKIITVLNTFDPAVPVPELYPLDVLTYVSGK